MAESQAGTVKKNFSLREIDLKTGTLFGIFFLLLAILPPRLPNYPFYFDDYRLLQLSQRIPHDWTAIWAVNQGDRRHPLSMVLLFIESLFFKNNAVPYFVVLLSLHFVNALLLLNLARKLGAPPLAQWLCGLLFLSSSAFYQTTICIAGTVRILCFFFILLGLHAWTRYLKEPKPLRLWTVIILQTAAILSMEDALIFPFLAWFLARRLGPHKKEASTGIRDGVVFLCFTAAAVLVPLTLPFFLSPKRAEKIAWVIPLHLQAVTFIKMLIQPLFIPERGFLPHPLPARIPEILLRLAPLVFWSGGAGLLVAFSGKAGSLVSRTARSPAFWTGLGWAGITALPYLSDANTFEHSTRHLYAPMAGFSLAWGCAAAHLWQMIQDSRLKFGRFFFFLMITYIVVLNIATTGFHYDRFVREVEQNPRDHFRTEVNELFPFARRGQR